MVATVRDTFPDKQFAYRSTIHQEMALKKTKTIDNNRGKPDGPLSRKIGAVGLDTEGDFKE